MSPSCPLKLVLLLLVALLIGCSEQDSRAIETLASQAVQTGLAEGQRQVETQAAQLQATAIAAAKTAVAQGQSGAETRAAEVRQTAEAALKTEVVKRLGKKWKVVLDPGHGWGGDSGAVGNDMKEKDVALDIALRAKPILEAQGVEVVMTRTGDDFNHELTYPSVLIWCETTPPHNLLSQRAREK